LNDQVLRRRRRWRCRRGLLELDLLLQGYFDEYYDGMAPSQRDLFGELLEQADEDLGAWILRGETLDQERFRDLVTAIRGYHPR